MGLLDVLLILLAVAGGLLLSVVLAMFLTRALLRRKLRLHPRRRANVPTTWLVSPRQQARAHRRLRAATARARLEAASFAPAKKRTGSEPLEGILDDLHQRAYELEHLLRSTTRTSWSYQRSVMPHVWRDIIDLEQRVNQLSYAAVSWRRDVIRPVSSEPRAAAAYHATVVERLDEVAERITAVRSAVSPQYQVIDAD